MGGSRRRLKRDKPKVKVGVQKRKKIDKALTPKDILQGNMDLEKRLKKTAAWDQKRPLTSNYKSIGLVLDPNEGFGRNQAPLPLVPKEQREAQQEETFSDDDELRALNGQERKTGKALPKRLTGHQKQIMEKLIAKHGDDCKAMMLDRKLNTMQHSEGILKQMLESLSYWSQFEGNVRHDFRAPFKPYKRL